MCHKQCSTVTKMHQFKGNCRSKILQRIHARHVNQNCSHLFILQTMVMIQSNVYNKSPLKSLWKLEMLNRMADGKVGCPTPPTLHMWKCLVYMYGSLWVPGCCIQRQGRRLQGPLANQIISRSWSSGVVISSEMKQISFAVSWCTCLLHFAPEELETDLKNCVPFFRELRTMEW